MKKTKKGLATVVLPALMLAASAGCGDDAGGSGSEGDRYAGDEPLSAEEYEYLSEQEY